MNFNVPLILIGLVFSAVGYVYFSYGKRLQKYNIAICGVALMVYPYFFDNLWATVAVGCLLSGVPFLFKWW